MLTIYLVRHGETHSNRENRLQGWQDSPLTEKGIKNAKLLGKKLSKIEFNAVYQSPIKRVVKTAENILFGRNIPTITEENLKEYGFGEWEGKTKEEVSEKYKQEYDNYWNAPHKYDHRPHNAEGFEDFRNRVETALKRVLTDNDSGNILMVTHGITIQAIFAYIMDLPTERFWEAPFPQNTSLSILHWDGERLQLQMVGDTSHFENDH